MTSARILILAGAPHRADLDWSELFPDDRHLPAFLPDNHRIDAGAAKSPTTSSAPESRWRHVSLDKTDWLHQKQSQQQRHDGDNTSDGYVEHSLAFLDNLQSSQIAAAPVLQGTGTVAGCQSTLLTVTSFMDTEDDLSSLETPFSLSGAMAKVPPIGRLRGPVAPLKRLPSVSHLLRLRPQTMSVNLVVGIISVSSSRTVYVKRGDYHMDVVDITVGDDTMAGFAISAWLSAENGEDAKPKTHSTDALREAIRMLRPGHVVFIGNVALTTFNGMVFGQTLNRRASGIVTTFHHISTKEVVDLAQDLQVRMGAVQMWVDNFVGRHGTKRRLSPGETSLDPAKKSRELEKTWLPDDSQ